MNFYILGMGLGAWLAILAAVATLAVALLSLWGHPVLKSRLSRLGRVQFGGLLCVCLIAVAQIAIAHFEKKAVRIAELNSEYLVVTRVNQSVEALKNRLLCRPALSPSPFIEHDEFIRSFMHPSCGEPATYATIAREALQVASAELDEVLKAHSNTLSSQMKDLIVHFRSRSGLQDLEHALRDYAPVEKDKLISFGDFADYLIEVQFGRNRLQHVFMALVHLEEHVQKRVDELQLQRRNILPQCTSLLDTVDCAR